MPQEILCGGRLGTHINPDVGAGRQTSLEGSLPGDVGPQVWKGDAVLGEAADILAGIKLGGQEEVINLRPGNKDPMEGKWLGERKWNV
jgi:hypothetical protein